MIEQFELYLVELNRKGMIRTTDYKAITEMLFSLFLTKATEFIISAPKNARYNKKAVDAFAAEYATYIATLLKV
jgi:hypothetical protein